MSSLSSVVIPRITHAFFAKTRSALVGSAIAMAMLSAGPNEALANAGSYTLAGSNGEIVCKLTLGEAVEAVPLGNGEKLPGGSVNAGGACTDAFAELGGARKWIEGSGTPLTFVDANGEAVVVFQDIGGGILVGRFDAGGIAYLADDLESVAAAEPQGQAGSGGAGFEGLWTFARGDDGSKPLCSITLSGEQTTGEISALTPNEGCSDAITVLDLAGWKLEGGVLSVHDTSGKMRLSFSQQDGPVWIRDPGGSRPLFLIRQN